MVDALSGRRTYGKFNSPSSISATVLSSLAFIASLLLFIWFSFLSIRTWSTISRVFSPILSTALHGSTPHISHSSFLSFYSLLICYCVYFPRIGFSKAYSWINSLLLFAGHGDVQDLRTQCPSFKQVLIQDPSRNLFPISNPSSSTDEAHRVNLKQLLRSMDLIQTLWWWVRVKRFLTSLTLISRIWILSITCTLSVTFWRSYSD